MTWSSNSVVIYKITQSIATNIHVVQFLYNGIFVSANSAFQLVIYNSTNGNQVKTLNGHTNTLEAIEVIDNTYMVSGGLDSTIRLWNYINGTNVQVMNVSAQVYCLKLLNNGLLASGDTMAFIKIWNFTIGKIVANLTGHTGTVRAMDLLSTNVLASGDTNKVVIIWNLITNTLLYSITTAHTYQIYALRGLSSNSFATGISFNFISKI